MLCDICHKNEATIHVQEIVNGKKNTLNICAFCAAEHNIAGDDVNGFNLAEILYNISSQMLKAQSDSESAGIPVESFSEAPSLLCQCGWDTTKFRETGRLGCAKCYNVFAPLLVNALQSMHKGTTHLGKHPADAKSVNANERAALKILNLQKELDECVKRENYERAAKLRDEINAIKQKEQPPRK